MLLNSEIKEIKSKITRFSELNKKFLPIFILICIILGLIFGYYFSYSIKFVKPYVSIPLFIMLYPMMINLKIEKIKDSLKNLKLMISAIILNFIISPLLGDLIGTYFIKNLDMMLYVGFVLKSTVPCSGMVIAWTGFAKGKVESALIIVSLSLILSIFLIPFWMVILVGIYIQIDILMMLQKLLLIILLPIIAGYLTRLALIKLIKIEKFKKIQPIFPTISSFGMYMIVFISISLESTTILLNLDYILMISLGIIILYPSLAIIGIIYSKFTNCCYEDTIALTYGITAKNHSITIAIALTTFGGLTVLPAAFAPIIQIPLMILILKLSSKIEKICSPNEKTI